MDKIKFSKNDVKRVVEKTMNEMQNPAAEVDKLVAERKRTLAYEICKKSKELDKLIHQWTTLFPDEITPSDYYRKEISQYDILNEMEV